MGMPLFRVRWMDPERPVNYVSYKVSSLHAAPGSNALTVCGMGNPRSRPLVRDDFSVAEMTAQDVCPTCFPNGFVALPWLPGCDNLPKDSGYSIAMWSGKAYGRDWIEYNKRPRKD